MKTEYRIGLDIGAVFVRMVGLNSETSGHDLRKEDHTPENIRFARRHKGNPVQVLKEGLQELKLPDYFKLGITGSGSFLVTEMLDRSPVDPVQAEIKAVKKACPEVRNIINVGGGSVTLIQLDDEGNFIDHATNSLCAAGTGSFLDQQAGRLGISYQDLHDFPVIDNPPSIATRCSVFAKTDLIHRQQEGYGKPALWSGLCKGMTGTFLNTLLRGRPLSGLTIITGGVAQNQEVIRWLKVRYGDLVRTYQDAPYSGAIGAACLASEETIAAENLLAGLQDRQKTGPKRHRGKPLLLEKSIYPSFEVAESYLDQYENEIRISNWEQESFEFRVSSLESTDSFESRVSSLESTELTTRNSKPETRNPVTTRNPKPAYLGIDVGSTSTKAILLSPEGEVIADIYRRTAGDPIGATRAIFSAISEIGDRRKAPLKILGAGTTGSGRKLVGQVIGADVIVNEITAHLKGAQWVDPEVETIFEIGGQDSKYIRAKGGHIVDSNMNYVCAAGTGSFVEEAAKRLGFSLDEIGDIALGLTPPPTSDRCTVFMEQDVDRLIRKGYTRQECMAAVLYSVVKNYLNKVVGKRSISQDKIFFQGATARNKALVAAFEQILDAKVIVSPYCHVLGSFGTALLTKDFILSRDRETSFKGLDLSKRKIELKNEICQLCQNHCQITLAEIEGESERPSWGYMCGRDPAESKMRVKEEFLPFRKRQKLLVLPRSEADSKPETRDSKLNIGLPQSLYTYTFLPLWREFFTQLGCQIQLSPKTDEDITRKGVELTAADFCLPVKIAHGHAHYLAVSERVDFIFMPYMISLWNNPKTTNTFLCPYVQTQTSFITSALSLHGISAERILSPVIDLRLDEKKVIKGLYESLGGVLNRSRKQIASAWKKAAQAQQEFKVRCKAEGEQLLNDLKRRGQKAIVIMGRPYNTCDLGSNLGLPQKIAELGLPVIPMDMLPYNIEEIDPAFKNMYWAYGQHIVCAAQYIRNNKDLFGIYFTNFSCGPDSFLLGLVEEIMGDKPFLTLELDEHGGDAGYMTRVEAFFDVIRDWKEESNVLPVISVDGKPDISGRKLWIPPMHPIGSRLFASAFNAFGYQSEALPSETPEILELGLSLTRGSECLPAAVTIGGLIYKLREIKANPAEHAFFMPTADGPCRFGQYHLLHRIILDRLDYKDLVILSPTSYNAYQGLPQGLRRLLWKAILTSDVLYKAGCKIRPYEQEKGRTDHVQEEGIQRMEEAFARGADLKKTLRSCLKDFLQIPTINPGSKPLVGIVGEIYIRCNYFSNDELVRAIESLGGEAWLSPVSEWILYTSFMETWTAKEQGENLYKRFKVSLKNRFLLDDEEKFYALADSLLKNRHEPDIEEVIKEGEKYLPRNFYGEAILTLGRAALFAGNGARLIINAAPFSCMPGTLTAALSEQIKTDTNIPIVNMFYDGKEGLNQRLSVFMNNLIPCRLNSFELFAGRNQVS